jgi:hypothetical protein
MVTLHSPEEQDCSGKPREEALAWCFVWLMAKGTPGDWGHELGVGPLLVCRAVPGRQPLLPSGRLPSRARIAGFIHRTVLGRAVAGVGLVSNWARRRRRGDPRLPSTTPLTRNWITPDSSPLPRQRDPQLPARPVGAAKEHLIREMARHGRLIGQVLLEVLLQETRLQLKHLGSGSRPPW